jgi:hypothetical protein
MTDTTGSKSNSHGVAPRLVWRAALLGGLLGGLVAFGLSRVFPAPLKSPPPAPLSEGRQFADDMIGYLKAGKNEDFVLALRSGFPGLNDEQYNQLVRQELFKFRDGVKNLYGQPSEFGFVHESALGPYAVQCAYMEKFPRGCVVWTLTCFNSSEGWRLLGYRSMKLENAFDLLH